MTLAFLGVVASLALPTAATAFVFPSITTMTNVVAPTTASRLSMTYLTGSPMLSRNNNGVYPSLSSNSMTTVASAPMVAQRWRKSTKQVATLGPASSTKEMIEKLFLAGTDVFRLNFSHGSQEQKKELLLIIREIEEKYAHPIAILGDLQGPKLRVSSFL